MSGKKFSIRGADKACSRNTAKLECYAECSDDSTQDSSVTSKRVRKYCKCLILHS